MAVSIVQLSMLLFIALRMAAFQTGLRLSTILGVYLSIFLTGRRVDAGDLRYYGCFRDAGTRDLKEDDHKSSLRSSLTPESCHYVCTHIIPSYTVAGVENGNECFCDNDFGTYGQIDAANCDKTCAGDRNQRCGGHYSLGIYSMESFSIDPLTTEGYLGCFHTPSEINGPTYTLSQTNSPAECLKKCFYENYKFAGVQQKKCMCGNSYGSRCAPARDCNERCVGNSRKICGGRDALSIYFTGSWYKSTPNGDLD